MKKKNDFLFIDLCTLHILVYLTGHKIYFKIFFFTFKLEEDEEEVEE